MLTLLKRLVVSLLGAAALSIVAYQVAFRLAEWQLQRTGPLFDGQAAMSVFFGAAFVALAAALLTSALLFWWTRNWR